MSEAKLQPDQQAGPAPVAAPDNGKNEAPFGVRVSLMPSDLAGERRVSLMRWIVVLAAVLVVETLAIGGAYIWLRGKERALEAEVAARNGEIAGAQAQAERLEQELGGEASLGAQVRAAEAALGEHVAWVGLLGRLERLTLPSVEYVSLTADARTGLVALDVRAGSYREAAEQLVLYREHPDIREARATAVSALVDDEGLVVGVAFSVALTFDETAWDFVIPSGDAADAETPASEPRPATGDAAASVVVPSQPPAQPPVDEAATEAALDELLRLSQPPVASGALEPMPATVPGN
jgi:hypothetical protein